MLTSYHQICLILLSNVHFGVQSLQALSVDFVPPNLFDFSEWCLLCCPISTGSEYWSCTIKSVRFCWATSASLSDLYSLWALILCHQICLILLSEHPIWCSISTASECWFCATKSAWFFWATSTLVSDLCSQWVLILCHQIWICSILLSDICFGVWSLQGVSVGFVPPNLFNFLSNACFCVWSLQVVSVDFLPPNMFDFLSNICFGVWSLQAVSVDFVPPNMFNFPEQHPLWCPISIASECWFCATKSAWFFWATSTLVSDLCSQWVLSLCHQIWICCWVTSALLSDICREWMFILCHQICSNLLSDICFGVWSLQAVSVEFVPPNMNMFHFTEWHLLWWFLQFVSVDFVSPNLFHFAEQHLLWCPMSTGSECWFCATRYVSFCWVTSTLVSTASEC